MAHPSFERCRREGQRFRDQIGWRRRAVARHARRTGSNPCLRAGCLLSPDSRHRFRPRPVPGPLGSGPSLQRRPGLMYRHMRCRSESRRSSHGRGAVGDQVWRPLRARPASERHEWRRTPLWTRHIYEEFRNHVGLFDAILTLGALSLEASQLDEAERLIEEAVRRSERIRPPFELLGLIERARLFRARGELVEGLGILERARTVLPTGSRSPLIQRADVLEARLRIDLGEPARAAELARTLPRSPTRCSPRGPLAVGARTSRPS